MVRSIMLPIDLAHTDALKDAVGIAVGMAKSSDATLTMVGVTGSGPSDTARNPEEFDAVLAKFADDISAENAIQIKTKSLVSVDEAVELGDKLVTASQDLNVDLIVMASHVPGFIEHIIASNAGYVASHAKCSVYVVR